MDYGVASYISEIEENLQKLPPFWHVSCEKVTILQHNRQVLSLQQLFCLMCRMTQKLAVNDFTQRGDDELCIAQYEIFSFFQTNFFAQGLSTKNIRFFGLFFDLPTYPYPIFPNKMTVLAYQIISDFLQPIQLPKNRISFLDAPILYRGYLNPGVL